MVMRGPQGLAVFDMVARRTPWPGWSDGRRLDRWKCRSATPAAGFSRQARGIKVVDLARLRVQQVEDVEVELDARPLEDIADARPRVVVNDDQTLPSEISGRGPRLRRRNAPNHPISPASRAGRTDEVGRARNQAAVRRIVGEVRGEGEIDAEARP